MRFKKQGVTVLYTVLEAARLEARGYKIKNMKKYWTKETVFVNIIYFIFYGVSHVKTNLNN